MSIKNKLTRSVLYCYLPIVVLFAVLRMLSTFGVFSFLGKTGSYIINAFIQIGLLFTISVFLFSFLQKNKIKDTFNFYGYRKMSFKAVLISVLIGIIIYVLNIFVASFFNNILSLFGYKFQSSSILKSYPVWLLFINIFITAVLPAVCEETAHRGMLLKGLSPLGRKKAIIISAILFGLLHMNIEQFFYATIIGVVLGYISTVCETIYPAIIIHFMNNAISVFMGFSQVNNLGFDFLFTWINNSLVNNPVLGFIFMLLFISLLLISLKYLIKLLFKNTSFKRMSKLQEELFKVFAREAYLRELEDMANGKITQNVATISFEDFDKLYKSKSIDIGQISQIENQYLYNNEMYKMDKVTKILLIAVFLLSGMITFFTFIWGIL